MKKLFVVIGFIAAFTSANIFAQTMNDALRLSDIGLGSNARALGMGNAFTALSDDFSGNSFNPAGLALVRRLEFSGSINYNQFNNTTKLFGTPTDADNSATDFSAMNFVFPFPTFRGSLVFSLGYSKERSLNSIIGFNGFNNGYNSMIQDLTFSNQQYERDIPYFTGVSYDGFYGDTTDINGGLQQHGEYKSEGNIGKWAFSGAFEFAKNTYFGATLNLYTGTYKWNSDFNEDDVRNFYGSNLPLTPNDPNTADFRYFYYNQMLNWDISGYDLKLGFLVQPTNHVRFGVTVKFPTTFTIDETYSLYGEASYGTGAIYTTKDQEVASLLTSEIDQKYDITTPYEFTGGVAVNYKGLVLSGDASIIDFTQMEFSDGLDKQFMQGLNTDIEKSFRTVVNLNVGAEYTIPMIGLRLRGGFIYNPSPYKDDPSKYDRKYFTGGLGLLLNESVTIDAAYVHGWWETYGENYGYDESRTYQEISMNNILFTMSYRF